MNYKRETSATALVAELTDFWWNPKRPDQTGLWESKVRLSEAFFNEIVSHPVPLDLTTLKALKRSPLGLDLYLWLTYRIFALTDPQRPGSSCTVSLAHGPGQSQLGRSLSRPSAS